MGNFSDLASSLSAINNATKAGVEGDVLEVLEEEARKALRLCISETSGSHGTH